MTDKQFTEEYILSELEAGRSLEDIGNDFANLLNSASTRFQEEKKKKEEAQRAAALMKYQDIAAEVEPLLDVLSFYYPQMANYEDKDIETVTRTIIAYCDLMEKLDNCVNTDDYMGAIEQLFNIENFNPLGGPEEKKTKGGDSALSDLVRSFIQ